MLDCDMLDCWRPIRIRSGRYLSGKPRYIDIRPRSLEYGIEIGVGEIRVSTLNALRGYSEYDREQAQEIDTGWHFRSTKVGYLLIGNESGYPYSVKKDLIEITDLLNMHRIWRRRELRRLRRERLKSASPL
jgi:hypothetical protein